MWKVTVELIWMTRVKYYTKSDTQEVEISTKLEYVWDVLQMKCQYKLSLKNYIEIYEFSKVVK